MFYLLVMLTLCMLFIMFWVCNVCLPKMWKKPGFATKNLMNTAAEKYMFQKQRNSFVIIIEMQWLSQEDINCL